jgi:hypothetical protein
VHIGFGLPPIILDSGDDFDSKQRTTFSILVSGRVLREWLPYLEGWVASHNLRTAASEPNSGSPPPSFIAAAMDFTMMGPT